MPNLPLAGGEQRRLSGALPRFALRNFYVEPDPSNAVDGLARLQRPGLEDWLTVGNGPINAVFQQDGTFGGDWFVLSGVQLYRINSAGTATLIGNCAGERAQIAASADKLIIVNGGFAREYVGGGLRTIIMPDGLPVQSVQLLAGYFVLTVQGSQRVYYLEPGDSDPDPLSFFEAERLPDAIVTAAVNGDELWLLGVQSEEVWVPSGDADAPFERVGARAYENGCKARDSLVQADNALMWVSNDYNVMLAQGVPEIISEPDIAEWLRGVAPSTMRAWFFKLDGHLFYVLTAGTETWAFDLSTRVWSRFCNLNSDQWRAHLGAGLVAGDATTGAVYRLIPRRSNDAGVPFERLITGGLEVIGAPVRCDSVSMRVIVGTGNLRTAGGVVGSGYWGDGQPWGDGFPWEDSAPGPNQATLELRWSGDEGRTWTDWRSINLGLEGQYNKPVVFRKLGLMRRPGRIFQFRATADREFRISHASFNEAVN